MRWELRKEGCPVRVREMMTKDLSAIARVNVDTFRTTQQGIVPLPLMDSLSYEGAEQRFQRMLNKTERLSHIFVAEDRDSLVGYAMGGLARESIPKYSGELYGIYLLPSYHGQGIGRHLAKAVATHLKAHEIHSMFAVVFSANRPAIKFYEALGGQKLFERTAVLAGSEVSETIYGWLSLAALLAG